SDPQCSLPIASSDILPEQARIRVNGGNFVIELRDPNGGKREHPLVDNQILRFGERRKLFIMATRFQAKTSTAVRLQKLDGMEAGHYLALEEGVAYVLGSHAACDLVVRGERIAKRHALAVLKDRNCIIADLGSETGILALGEKVGHKRLNT